MRRFVRRLPGRKGVPEGPPQSSARLLRDSRLLVEFPDAPQLLIGLTKAQRTDHFTDRDLRIVGPEDPAVLVFVIAKSDLIAVLFFECRTIMKLRTPRKNGITEV